MPLPTSKKLVGISAAAVVSAALPMLTAASAVAAEPVLRVAASTASVTDSFGATWTARTGFVGGRTATAAAATVDIAGTDSDALYRNGIFGMSGFSAPLASGTYDVKLTMAENYFTNPGRRVFDVTAEGKSALQGVDIFAAVGKNAAYDKVFRVVVTDGILDLGFINRVDNAVVSGIAATPVDVTAPESTLTASATIADAGKTAAWTFASDEAGSHFECQLDSGAWAGCTSPVTFTGLSVGTHSVGVRAIDEAGNVDTTPAMRQWTVAAPPAPVLPTRPGPTNTGVPAGTKLTPYYGNLTITTAGAKYDSLDIHGFVTIKAPNVKITRSIVRGGVATGNIGLVTNVDQKGAGFVIEDSELVPEHPSVWIDAIKGFNYTARRINAHGTVDTAKVYGVGNVTIENSWLHDTKYYDSDPNQGGSWTHNDGVQVLGGSNIRILNNSISGANNAAIQVTQTTGPVTDMVFSGNYADNGGCTINLNNKGFDSMTGITVSNNRYGRNTRNADCAIIATNATTIAASNNVWDDTGAAVRIRRG